VYRINHLFDNRNLPMTDIIKWDESFERLKRLHEFFYPNIKEGYCNFRSSGGENLEVYNSVTLFVPNNVSVRKYIQHVAKTYFNLLPAVCTPSQGNIWWLFKNIRNPNHELVIGRVTHEDFGRNKF
jgi:hypothetical protein